MPESHEQLVDPVNNYELDLCEILNEVSTWDIITLPCNCLLLFMSELSIVISLNEMGLYVFYL